MPQDTCYEEVCGRGYLDVGAFALAERYLFSVRLHHRSVVGEFRAVVGLVGPAQQVGAEDLRRLYRPQRLAVYRPALPRRRIDLPERIGGAYGGDGRPVPFRRCDACMDEAFRDERSYAVVHGDIVARTERCDSVPDRFEARCPAGA